MSDDRAKTPTRGLLLPRPPRDTAEDLVGLRAQVENLVATTAARLDAGASAMADLRHDVKEAKAGAAAANAAAVAAAVPRPTNWRLIATLGVSALAGFATLVSMLSKAPDRPEFQRATEAAQERLRQVESDVAGIRLEQVRARGAIEAIQAKQVDEAAGRVRLEQKLDTLIRRPW